MRLKKLVITGFKSFAEKTVLNFEKGITCIVGPNGCGKSNISDAFRWVLGEQSAKSLRGHKMPDVIFAGASKRQCLNFAEVSLTLTDVQDALPVDYEEVTITRKLHRSGESEYFLNSNPVRLKDIHSLLLDSGIGKNAFSIFEQGKIDQIINYSPVDRRFIFEEAAGIVRFLVRKQEALKRLEQADLNLSRVQDIHLEVEKNILILQKQAEKAAQFKESQFRLESLEKTALVVRWQSNRQKKESFEQTLKDLQVKWQECTHSSLAVQEKARVIKKSMEENERKRHLHQSEFFKFQSSMDIQKNDLKNTQLRIDECQLLSSKLKRELEEIGLAQQTRAINLVELRKNFQKIEGELAQFELQLNDQEGKLKDQEKEVFQLRQDVQLKNQTLLKLIEQENICTNELKQLEFWIESDSARLQQVKIKSEETAIDLTLFQKVSEEKKHHLQQIADVIDVYKDRLDQFVTDLSQFNQQIEGKKKEFENLRKKNFETKARHKVLLKMQEDFEGFSIGSKKLMQASLDPQSHLYLKLQPLYEFFKPEPEHAEALSAILRVYAQTLVVETKIDLEMILNFAQEAGIHDFSLLCRQLIEENSSTVSLQSNPFISEKNSNSLTTHFLQEVQAWQDFSAALNSQPRQEGWINGGYFDQRGVYFQIKLNENQVFMRESELTQLIEEIEQQEESIQKLENEINHLQQKKSLMQNERIEVDSQLRREEMKLVEINFGLQRALADHEKGKLQLVNYEKELEELQTKIHTHTDLLKSSKENFGQINQKVTQIKQHLIVVQEELQRQEQNLTIQQQDEKNKGQLYQKMLADKNRLAHECHLIESKEQDYECHVDRITNELSDTTEKQLSLKETIVSLQESLQKNEKEMHTMQMTGNELNEENHSLKCSLSEFVDEMRGLEETTKKLEMQMTNLNVQLEHVSQLLDVFQSESTDKYALEIDELVAIVQEFIKPLEQIEKQIRQIKQILNEAGDVNLMAIEELEKHRVRYDFLSQQMADLSHTKQELLQIIAQLNEESHRLFRETFNLVRSNFQKNFAILFNGGEADLQFTEGAENILEAGIEIIAKPPGKQMRSISLLSGGEKCLTAVALLFAIFEVKASPFCILDEIDAPLDDSNIDRFVNVVRHFAADRCQFLIITHNKRTMAISDRIFGVSMEEKGVSKLLSLEFSHELEPEVALVH